jgi:hypothetical protein
MRAALVLGVVATALSAGAALTHVRHERTILGFRRRNGNPRGARRVKSSRWYSIAVAPSSRRRKRKNRLSACSAIFSVI